MFETRYKVWKDAVSVFNTVETEKSNVIIIRSNSGMIDKGKGGVGEQGGLD